MGRDELEALPVGSVVKAHWPDGSQPDYQATRCAEFQSASAGQYGVLGGRHWTGMAGWGAEITVLYRAEA